MLPVLAKLLSEPEVREEVPHVLSRLLTDNKELQAAAADADAVSKLAGFLRREDCSQRLKVKCRLKTTSWCSKRCPCSSMLSRAPRIYCPYSVLQGMHCRAA